MSTEASAFLDRVFARNPTSSPSGANFDSWTHAGRPTSEGFGLVPASGVDPEAMMSAIMDVGNYKGNIAHVLESRVVSDPSYVPPAAVRFYQKINVPALAKIHMELVLTDFGTRDGWRVAAWHQLDAETNRLSARDGARTQYNVGAWLIRPNAVGYALSSAPRRDDVGRLKFAALTKGADAAASRVVQANIEGMIAWSKRR